MNENFPRNVLLACLVGLVLVGSLFIAVYSVSAHAEEGSEDVIQFGSPSETTSVSDSGDVGTNDTQVNVNVVQETVVDPANSPATLKANSVGYTPIADMLSSSSYANILYDVFLNQGNTFDDFIIFQAGDYRYFLLYGSIDDDLSFSDCDVVQLDYTSNWQSGKRYTLTYSEDVSGTFRPNGFIFLSNKKAQNAQSPNVTFERKEQYKMRIALYVLAVMTLFSSFRFFRPSKAGGF